MTAGAAPITVVAPGEDLTFAVARLALQRFHDPDGSLSRLSLVVASRAMIRPLRETLVELAANAGHGAILGPDILTLPRWLVRESGTGLPSTAQRELELYELLADFPELFPVVERWQHCASLLPLIEQLEFNQVEHCESIAAQIRSRTLPRLGHEARVVDTIWRAVRDDPDSRILARASQVRAAFARFYSPANTGQAIFVACDEFRPLECQLLADGFGRDRTAAVFQSTLPHPNPAIAEMMSSFETDSSTDESAVADFLAAAIDGGDEFSSSDAEGYADRWALVACTDDEAQVQFITDDIAHAGAAQIRTIVVAENRLLARRLRAALETHGHTVNDQAGWPLSTTAAATVIDQLMQAVAGDFDHATLFELLLSPFLEPSGWYDSDIDSALLLLDRIVRRRAVYRGLQRYLRQIDALQSAATIDDAAAALLRTLLERLESGTALLAQYRRDRTKKPCTEVTGLLLSTIEAVGALRPLSSDQAGSQVLKVLRTHADQGPAVSIDWQEFRAWLSRALEHESFYPGEQRGSVSLMSLRDAAVTHYDRVYLLGANHQKFPAQAANVTAWFNDEVRYELGVETHRGTQALFRHRLRILMANAGSCIACHARESLGEPQLPAKWLYNLEQHHVSVFGRSLLRSYEPRPPVEPESADATAALALASTRNPQVPIPAALLPRDMSASAHQRLVDCPYLYYVQDCLGLRDLDEIDEKMKKLDYGNLVHASLREFHTDPSTAALLRSDFESAVERLSSLSQRLFARYLESSFEHRAWWYRWRRAIPGYLRWQRQRLAHLEPVGFEQEHKIEFDEQLTISGKIDRVDRSADGKPAIVDYKTGNAANTARVLNGEDVQLTTYALLFDELAQMEYVRIGNTTISSGLIADADLAETTGRAKVRLGAALDAIRAGLPAPAWQNNRCRYCQASGICRLQTWQ